MALFICLLSNSFLGRFIPCYNRRPVRTLLFQLLYFHHSSLVVVEQIQRNFPNSARIEEPSSLDECLDQSCLAHLIKLWWEEAVQVLFFIVLVEDFVKVLMLNRDEVFGPLEVLFIHSLVSLSNRLNLVLFCEALIDEVDVFYKHLSNHQCRHVSFKTKETCRDNRNCDRTPALMSWSSGRSIICLRNGQITYRLGFICRVRFDTSPLN